MAAREIVQFRSPRTENVEQLHNYTIVNGLFLLLMCKMSKYVY